MGPYRAPGTVSCERQACRVLVLRAPTGVAELRMWCAGGRWYVGAASAASRSEAINEALRAAGALPKGE